MPRRHASRILIAGEHTFRWSIRHLHERVDEPQRPPLYLDCREIVTIRRHNSRGRLEVVFRAGEDRLVPDGWLVSGAVMLADGRALNLHQPGIARALLDEALKGGWQPDRPVPAEIDGWSLFDAVCARRGMPEG